METGTRDAVMNRTQLPADLLAFFADRLKVQLREQGARHDLVDAVFALEGQDDLLLIVRRVDALAQFLDSEDGKNLLAGYKRATNIIRIEEKKDGRQYTGAPQPKLYQQAEEKSLAKAIDAAKIEAARAVQKEDFAAAMRAMAKLRPSVDAFFDKVTVNVEDKALARKQAQAAQRNSRGDARRGRFLQNRGVIISAPPTESRGRRFVPAPLAGEGSSALQPQDWVRGQAATPHPIVRRRIFAMPSPARGEGARRRCRIHARTERRLGR